MNIAFFGSSLVSAYWNGAATYYRGLVRALAERGHSITFYEPDAFERQQHRDIDDPDWATVVVYGGEDERDALAALEQAAGADILVKASGVGVFDALLEREVTEAAAGLRIFWDVDAPATLGRLEADPTDPFHELLPRYDLVLTYGGGDPVVERYGMLGARHCVPIYNALDPETHHRVPPDERFACDLAFLGNRLPDREARVEDSSSAPRAMPTRRRSCSAATAGRRARCRRTSATSATSTRRTTTRSTRRRARCSTSAAGAWPRTASRPRRVSSRQRAPERA